MWLVNLEYIFDVAKLLLYIIDLVISLVIFMVYPQEIVAVIAVTIFTSILSVYNMLTIYNGRLTLSSVLLFYTILTEFGLFIPYALLGDNVVGIYKDYTLMFLTSSFLGSALLLGNIAIICYDIARILYIKSHPNITRPSPYTTYSLNAKSIGSVSTLLIAFVLLFFIINVLLGNMKLFGTYDDYIEFSHSSSIYPYVLVTFYAGVLYLSVSGSVKQRQFGWFLWLLVVIIFAFNGNKGEFLYSLLAVIGLKGVLGQKLSWKMVVGGLLILIVVIPSITLLRHEGIANSLGSVTGSFMGAFVEMGMQIRTTVYTLEYLDDGTFNYLLGQSYYQPIINILTPFMNHTIATAHVTEMFPGYGYNQVAESYLNFGLPGVVGFYSLMGYFLCKYENELKDLLHLAFLGTITCVLINASRNYFAFVPGQIIMMAVFYFYFKTTTKKNKNREI